MSKIAIFTEGLTEQLFVEKLIAVIAGERNVRFELRRTSGEVSDRRRFRLLRSVSPDEGQAHYVLIVNCSNDELVNSRIREEYESLERAHYDLIIGIRDVYPQPREAIPILQKRLLYGLRTSPIPVVGILVVMEIEAWFLAEYTHFHRLNPGAGVTPALVRSWFGFDPETDDMALRDTPAYDMRRIYFLAATEYRKQRDLLERTVALLDVEGMCLSLVDRYPPFKLLVDSITTCLFPS